MHLGMMNDPAKKLSEEVKFAGQNGFDFLDLTLEPPFAQISDIQLSLLQKQLQEHNLFVIGHTNFYLTWASQVTRMRNAALAELKEHIYFFAELGAKKVNIHSHWYQPNCPVDEIRERNIESLAELLLTSKRAGVTLMLEHQPTGHFNTPTTIAPILEALPDLRFHLDIAHAYVAGQGHSLMNEFLEKFGKRLAHVHLSDNHGQLDEHLPLGQGTLDWKSSLEQLHQVNYDQTLTLEVFTVNRQELLDSLSLVRTQLI